MAGKLGTVAVHAGVLKLGQTGIVKVTILPGQNGYTGSTRNGISTSDYGPWGGSFVVVNAPDGPDDPEGIATGDVTVNGQPFSAGTVKYGSTIDVTSHGEGDPMVKTPDETPEPRNRRVEITVR